MVFRAKLIKIEHIDKLEEIPEGFLIADTGFEKPMSVFERMNLKPRNGVIVLTFKK